MTDAFPLSAQSLDGLLEVARALTRIQEGLPEYLWLDTTINMLISVDGEKPGLDDKASIGIMEFDDFGEYSFRPFATPRRRAAPS